MCVHVCVCVCVCVRRTVLYIPSARVFLRGGLFEPRMPPDGSEPQEWDTPIQAQQLLLGMQQAHGDTLQSTPARLESTCALLAALRQDVTAQASGAAAPAAAATAAQGEGEDSQAAASSSGSSSQPAAESAASTSAAAAGGQDTLGELLTLGQATTDVSHNTRHVCTQCTHGSCARRN